MSTTPFNRDEWLLSHRPVLDLPPSDQSEVEAFHHQVLRPLLKLQNDLLLAQFAAWMKENKQTFANKEAGDQRVLIENACKTHKRLRAQAFGIIAGVMTRKEYLFYLDHQREIHKRMTSMWSKRVFDEREELV